MSKVRPAGQIRPSVKFYPARSLVMKYRAKRSYTVIWLAVLTFFIYPLETNSTLHNTTPNPLEFMVSGFPPEFSRKSTITSV